MQTIKLSSRTESSPGAPRSGWQVQRAVLAALFLREAGSRLSAFRGAWLWMLLEPLAHLAFLMMLFDLVQHRIIAGVESPMFIVIGLCGFFFVRNISMRCMDAIGANAALFAYRQVLPIDTVLVRAATEGVIMLLVTLALLAGAGLSGFRVAPDEPLGTAAAVAGLWLAGAGLGLVFSALGRLIPETAKLIRISFMPLYFVSGVMIPAAAVPQPYREWLFVNPLLHGLELLRGGFFSNFQMAQEASFAYLYGFAVAAVFFGLVLHVRFADRMAAQ